MFLSSLEQIRHFILIPSMRRVASSCLSFKMYFSYSLPTMCTRHRSDRREMGSSSPHTGIQTPEFPSHLSYNAGLCLPARLLASPPRGQLFFHVVIPQWDNWETWEPRIHGFLASGLQTHSSHQAVGWARMVFFPAPSWVVPLCWKKWLQLKGERNHGWWGMLSGKGGAGDTLFLFLPSDCFHILSKDD